MRRRHDGRTSDFLKDLLLGESTLAKEVLPREAYAIGTNIFKVGDPPRFAYLLAAGTVEIATVKVFAGMS